MVAELMLSTDKPNVKRYSFPELEKYLGEKDLPRFFKALDERKKRVASAVLRENPDAFMSDTHFHTLHSDGFDSLDSILEEANNLGFKFLCPTDHNILPSEKDLEKIKNAGIVPVLAVEYTVSYDWFRRGHVLIFASENKYDKVGAAIRTQRQNMAELLPQIDDPEIVLVVAHPEVRLWRVPPAVWEAYWYGIDGFESEYYAELEKKTILLGSDAHDRNSFGSRFTVVYNKNNDKIMSSLDIVRAIKEKRTVSHVVQYFDTISTRLKAIYSGFGNYNRLAVTVNKAKFFMQNFDSLPNLIRAVSPQHRGIDLDVL